MKKMDKNFWTYSLSLLLVAVLFIAIGGISLSRNAVKDDNKIFQNFNAKEKVSILSNENLRLDSENKTLSSENETLKSELESVKQSAEMLEAIIEADKFIKEDDFESANTILGGIDAEKLSPSALEFYNNLLNKVKENTNG